MRGWCLLTVLWSVLAFAPVARGQPYLPPPGRIFAGLTGGSTIKSWERLVGRHPPVFEDYMTWEGPTGWLGHRDPWFRARLGLALGTAPGYGKPGVITPEQIARGRSDRFLVALNRDLARSHRITYVRIMGEMNGYWNAYSAFAADGRSTGRQNSPYFYRQAFRRTALILRGGPARRIDLRLRALGLPPLQLGHGRHERNLPQPRVAILWVPQDAGSPEIAANAPAAYWPGGRYVDWVGTDFYASYPNFGLLDRFYDQFRGKPFVISEWALYGADSPRFVRELFAWVASHPRVRLLDYYQGFGDSSPANLARYPRSRAVLRRELHSRRFPAYPPEYRHPPRRRRHPEPPPLPPVQGTPPGPELCVPLLGLCLPL